MPSSANESTSRGRERRASPGERIARLATQFVISATAHWLAVGLVLAWAVTDLASAADADAHDLFEMAVASLSFLMLFLLQRSQSKDTLALQLKLDELIASSPRASNRVLNAEDISEEELARIRQHFELLHRLSREAGEGPLSEENAYLRHEEEQQHIDSRADEPMPPHRRPR